MVCIEPFFKHFDLETTPSIKFNTMYKNLFGASEVRKRSIKSDFIRGESLAKKNHSITKGSKLIKIIGIIPIGDIMASAVDGCEK